MIRIVSVEPIPPYGLRLGLSDGRTIDRDLAGDLWGPVFVPLRNPDYFAQVRLADYGTVVWPNGVDLDPDVLIWGETGHPPEERPHGTTRD